MSNDPLTLVYDALWNLLWDWPTLCKIISPGNRIKLIDSGEANEPNKESLSDADLPEIILFPEGQTPHIQRTSSSSTIVHRFTLRLQVGSKMLNEFFPLVWEVYRALSNWFSVLSALTWNDKQFVILARPIAVTEGFADRIERRGISGWVSIWSCEVTLTFTTTDLQDKEIN